MTMTSYRLCCALVVLIVQTCTVYGQEEIIKGSLTFVIDETKSMTDEINQVKEEVTLLFEKVLSSNTSQIENFVLVTFNDPTAQVRTITKDRNEFKRALAAITVTGNYDCPEYSMKGIELGLTESLPLSYLYVFTDASAKDYYTFEAIKSIAQRKQSQVVFILTGECGSERDADYQVYHKLAQATGGQVFRMMKDDVKDILKYIEESITGRGVTLVNKILPSGYGKKITYPVDSHTGEVLISVTGKDPRIGEVTGPGGSKPTTESVVSGKREMAVVKVKNAKPGDHEVEVGSSSATHVVITAKTDINFQLGFSIDRPNFMKDTVTRPAPGTAFLGIRLLGDGVNLTTVKILDLSDNVVTELPLELVDEKNQFYVTTSFNPPFTMFRVTVIGKDLKTGTPIERTSPTPISRQDPDCKLNINKDFPEKQPIMYSPSLEWPVFPVNKGYMIIPHADYFYFNCPSKFSNPNLPKTSNLMAFCERDNTVKMNGNIYNFADIQCNQEVKPEVVKTGTPCLQNNNNTETIKIGYRVNGKFLRVYEVCLDKKNNVPLFTEHTLSPYHTDRSTEADWSNSHLPQDFDTLYDCSRQMYNISTTLGRGLRRDSCCFGKRQLVNSRNLLPGVPTSSAYDYLNVIPHWSTCNSKNWENVEQSVRNLVKSAGRDLIVTTGTHDSGTSATDMTLHDGRGGKQPVAPLLWKVVQDRVQSASLAIIQLNIPELSPEDALDYVLCTDICENMISWIEPSNWHNVEDGYTYCCTITEFEKAFGYNGRFSPGMAHVLFDGHLDLDYYANK